jgi:dihydroceramide fatty acyl 2-hydroxylase
MEYIICFLVIRTYNYKYRDRLVFPPAFAVVASVIGYFTVCRIIYFENYVTSACYWSGFIIGYIIYDLCHYMLHHVDTSKHKGSYFHGLQKYHNQHHFGG